MVFHTEIVLSVLGRLPAERDDEALLTGELYGVALGEVRNGLENGVDVEFLAEEAHVVCEQKARESPLVSGRPNLRPMTECDKLRLQISDVEREQPRRKHTALLKTNGHGRGPELTP